jgi:hypothetical protein
MGKKINGKLLLAPVEDGTRFHIYGAAWDIQWKSL